MVELGVEALLGQQAGVGPSLHHPAVVDDQQLIRFPDGREPVGDDQRGAAAQGLLQCPLHCGLGLGVQVGGGLVEHDDVGRLEDEAGQGDPLLLAAGEPVAPFADQGVEPFGELGHQVAELGVRQGGEDLLLGGFGTGVHQVRSQGVVEEVRVLGHDADDVADGLHRGVADIDPVQFQGTCRHVVEAGDQ